MVDSLRVTDALHRAAGLLPGVGLREAGRARGGSALLRRCPRWPVKGPGPLLATLVLSFVSLTRMSLWVWPAPEVMIDGSEPRRQVLLWTQTRSGSRLTMHLLAAHPRSVVTEEPLRNRDRNDLNASSVFLKDILKCNFPQNLESSRERVQHLAAVDHEVRALCGEGHSLCRHPALAEAMCRSAWLNLIKVVSEDLRLALDLVSDPDLQVSVVHLVRDPRGLLASRGKQQGDFGPWVLGEDMYHEEQDLAAVCSRYRKDLASARSLRRRHPYRYTLVRYEDLARRPYREVRRLYAFMDLPYTALVASKVGQQTLGLYGGPWEAHPYSTVKNSSSTVFAWRDHLPFSEVAGVQHECGDVLRAYGYREYSSRRQYQEQRTSPALPLPPEWAPPPLDSPV